MANGNVILKKITYRLSVKNSIFNKKATYANKELIWKPAAVRKRKAGLKIAPLCDMRTKDNNTILYATAALIWIMSLYRNTCDMYIKIDQGAIFL